MDNELGLGHVLATGHTASSCSTCRRKVQIELIADGLCVDFDGEVDDHDRELAGKSLDKLLTYYGEHETAVADAIRFGVSPDPIGWMGSECRVQDFINYPEGHERG